MGDVDPRSCPTRPLEPLLCTVLVHVCVCPVASLRVDPVACG